MSKATNLAVISVVSLTSVSFSSHTTAAVLLKVPGSLTVTVTVTETEPPAVILPTFQVTV